jgi:hypothetical protein
MNHISKGGPASYARTFTRPSSSRTAYQHFWCALLSQHHDGLSRSLPQTYSYRCYSGHNRRWIRTALAKSAVSRVRVCQHNRAPRDNRSTKAHAGLPGYVTNQACPCSRLLSRISDPLFEICSLFVTVSITFEREIAERNIGRLSLSSEKPAIFFFFCFRLFSFFFLTEQGTCLAASDWLTEDRHVQIHYF